MNSPKFPYWRLNTRGIEDSETQSNVRKKYDTVKAYRSEIIDASTLIELQLNQILCDALVGASSGLQKQFKALILSAEFCSFFQKWRLIRSLINDNSVWWQACKPDCHGQQVNKLKNLISQRNMFAHGEIVVDSSTLCATLYYYEGKRKSVELTDSYVQEILDEAEELLQWLAEMELKFERNNKAL